MPVQPFNITNVNGAWQCNPTSETLPQSEGATFNVTCPPGGNGCRVCFSDTTVFGMAYKDFPCGRTLLPFAGAVGNSTTFNIQNSGATCPSGPGVMADPYDVTIGSDLPGGGGKHPRHHKK
ncbi:MAG: hypothetical protein LAQ30_21495 [Acidobacteriia bacterium]|nr:hypothetical protein [Terriglobia bacterium]